ncbi:cbb3-type cytochrome oxidase subunit 3 [Aromatoleum sp.]|uniref:cbb3-type cytochrome oxidase subunit 3 n=1 Tax=Aromatoleum sp. TaxID=2307007 RepID=UPI002FCC85FC
MDINDLRSLITVLSLFCFLGICFWAYSRRARAGFEEAAKLPFIDDDAPAPHGRRQAQEG